MIKYINAICKTSLSIYRTETWPNVFIMRPQIGDKIKSESGVILTILQIIHCYDFQNKTYRERYSRLEEGIYLEIILG